MLKRYIVPISALIGVFIVMFALVRTLNHPTSDYDPAAFLLGIASLAAAISGLGFALYGYFNTHNADKIVEEKLQKKFIEYENNMNEENYRMQEALQKLLTGYSVQFTMKDVDRAIELYKSAVKLYPRIYNGYISLAYAYWYDKKDFIKAKEYFELALKCNPDSYQILNDLARFSAAINEDISTYQYLKQVLEIKPSEYTDIENDPAFSNFKTKYQANFFELINQAKSKI